MFLSLILVVGDKMDELIWKLFKETGDVRYFLLNKKIRESDKDEDSRRERNHLKRSKL